MLLEEVGFTGVVVVGFPGLVEWVEIVELPDVAALEEVSELMGVPELTDDDEVAPSVEVDVGVTSPTGMSQTSSRRKSAPGKPAPLVTLALGVRPGPAQET